MRILQILIIFLFAQSMTLTSQQVNQIDANGKKFGNWIKFYDNGKVKYEGQFRNDRPYGKFTYYYSEGQKKAVSVFSDDGIIAHNTTYFKNGKLLAEGKYINQKKDSVWRYYLDENSNPLISTEAYDHGILSGESITFYPDSTNPAEIVFYQDGKKNGPLVKYFPDGKLMTESEYKNDLPNGDFIHYHPDGKVQIEGKYSNGEQIGDWKYFDEKGNPVDKDEFMKQDEVKEIKEE